MKSYYVTFRSVTFAQRGESLLRQGGFGCTLRRTPRWMEEQGCGYSLRLRHADGQKASAILKEKGVAYRKIYGQRENGSYEELGL